MNELKHYSDAKENSIQKYNKVLNGETLNISKFMYEYLGNPKDHVDYFNEDDHIVLQERLAGL